MHKANIDNNLKAARNITEQVLDMARTHGYRSDALFAIKLAMEEALVNAVRHGNGNVPGKSVYVEFDVDPHRTEIRITDEGDGFRPSDLPDPTVDENIQKPNGRGVMLIRAYMDAVDFNEKGNSVHMVKRNS